VRNLAAEDPRLRNVLVGEPLAWTVREPAPVFEAYALDPRGERRAVERFEEERAVGLRCRDTRVPGFYTLLYEEPDGARRLSRLFAANLPPEESRLERLSEATLGELRSHLGLEVSRPEEDLEPAAVAALARRNYRPLALAAALVFLLVEQILARACATTSRE
jgi:hypothetical protein